MIEINDMNDFELLEKLLNESKSFKKRDDWGNRYGRAIETDSYIIDCLYTPGKISLKKIDAKVASFIAALPTWSESDRYRLHRCEMCAMSRTQLYYFKKGLNDSSFKDLVIAYLCSSYAGYIKRRAQRLCPDPMIIDGQRHFIVPEDSFTCRLGVVVRDQKQADTATENLWLSKSVFPYVGIKEGFVFVG